mmetsp:Transcript_22487/g.52074  ORF Transcript_22487/g.52074 Transcript_22487/m.52074 type:complete len:200 (-) Transcript_22487:141-740(-)
MLWEKFESLIATCALSTARTAPPASFAMLPEKSHESTLSSARLPATWMAPPESSLAMLPSKVEASMWARPEMWAAPPEPEIAVFISMSHFERMAVPPGATAAAPPNSAVLFVKRPPVTLTSARWPTKSAPPDSAATLDEKMAPGETVTLPPYAQTAPPCDAVLCRNELEPSTRTVELLAWMAPHEPAVSPLLEKLARPT